MREDIQKRDDMKLSSKTSLKMSALLLVSILNSSDIVASILDTSYQVKFNRLLDKFQIEGFTINGDGFFIPSCLSNTGTIVSSQDCWNNSSADRKYIDVEQKLLEQMPTDESQTAIEHFLRTHKFEAIDIEGFEEELQFEFGLASATVPTIGTGRE